MKEQVIAVVTIMPLGTASTSLSQYVADCIRIAKQAPDVSYKLTSMGTILQGPLRRVLELIEEMHEVPFGSGAKRVLTAITIDDRRDKLATMESKVRAVNQLIADS